MCSNDNIFNASHFDKDKIALQDFFKFEVISFNNVNILNMKHIFCPGAAVAQTEPPIFHIPYKIAVRLHPLGTLTLVLLYAGGGLAWLLSPYSSLTVGSRFTANPLENQFF